MLVVRDLHVLEFPLYHLLLLDILYQLTQVVQEYRTIKKSSNKEKFVYSSYQK